MAALSAPRNTLTRGGEPIMLSVPLDASTKVYEGGLVMVKANGYGVPGASGATTNISFGIAKKTYDNSAGSAGAVIADCEAEVEVLLDSSGLTQASNGLYAYFTDDHTVTTTATGNSKVGTIVEVVSATQAWVYIGILR